MIKQRLYQTIQQRLSPQQVQQVKMLELTSQEMEDRVRQELDENPALEQADEWEPNENETPDDAPELEQPTAETDNTPDDINLEEYALDDDIPDYRYTLRNFPPDQSYEQIPYPGQVSLRENLLEQLHLRDLPEREMKIGEYILGTLDDDGYLRCGFNAIADDLLTLYDITASETEIEAVIRVVQDLDPPGIGAGNLQECLLLQLNRRANTPVVQITRDILSNCFDDFTKKHYDKIQRTLNLSEDQLKEAIKEIVQLNPKPGSLGENDLSAKLSQVTPEFIVETVNGEPELCMSNQDLPRLKVSREYAGMLSEYANNRENLSADSREAILFVKQKLDSAKWFIDAVNQRNTTLNAVMTAIMTIQRDFFLSGDETDLKPMILKDVAERCGYDISTVSRVSISKYVQTDAGIYPLKYFFSEGMQNEKGEEVSTREIKIILKETIGEEDKKQPLTDEKLVDVLKAKGYDVARRTVAKYREQLAIPIARLRKEL
jgi:RNA polymerase sigma-54 factor